MEIQRINNMSFGRKPNTREMKVYTRSLNQGLDLLGKQVDIIMHNASAPAMKTENTGIGSLFSRTSIQKLFPFLKQHAISNIQQEPNGLRQIGDSSPYAPESHTKNIFMIPLEKLASDEYGNILSKKTFRRIVRHNPSQTNVDYDYVRKMYDIALREAYQNGKSMPEFAEFKTKEGDRYEQSALFRILSKINNEQGVESWDKIDKNLYQNPNSKKSQNRIAELKENYKDEYDYYLFQQMLLEKENQKSNQLAQESGIKIIGDSPVASTKVENWVNQKLFLKGKAIGCPPDFFSKDGQRWGFKYYDPEKVFNKDGSLGEAGEILKKKYEEYFASFPGGIRIDHIIGLIDPFIYSTRASKMTEKNSYRIFSKEGSKYQKHTVDEFAALFNKIIIPAAEKYGLNKSSIICEDLGDKTKATKQVMDKLGLSGISVTQFDHRGAKTPTEHTIMLGSHDNQSFIEYVNDLFNIKGNNDKRKHFMHKTRLLANDTSATKAERSSYLSEIRSDKKKFIAASFAELFTSPAKRVQIFFADFWGLGKTYNRPGTTEGNWSLRLGSTFEKDYYEAVKDGKAPNLAQTIAQALRHRGLDKGNEKLMQDLDKSAKILNE